MLEAYVRHKLQFLQSPGPEWEITVPWHVSVHLRDVNMAVTRQLPHMPFWSGQKKSVSVVWISELSQLRETAGVGKSLQWGHQGHFWWETERTTEHLLNWKKHFIFCLSPFIFHSLVCREPEPRFPRDLRFMLKGRWGPQSCRPPGAAPHQLLLKPPGCLGSEMVPIVEQHGQILVRWLNEPSVVMPALTCRSWSFQPAIKTESTAVQCQTVCQVGVYASFFPWVLTRSRFIEHIQTHSISKHQDICSSVPGVPNMWMCTAKSVVLI